MKELAKVDFQKAIVYAEFVKSLNVACDNAGGIVDWDKYKNMTLEEFMKLIAPNGVRFFYDPKAEISRNVYEAELMEIAYKFLPNEKDYPHSRFNYSIIVSILCTKTIKSF